MDLKNFSESDSLEERTKPKEAEDSDAFEQALRHVGGIGLYQKLLFLGMAPFGFIYAYVYFVQMFITATPQSHWCRVPELAHLDVELRRNLTTIVTPDGWEKCKMYDANWTQVLLNLAVPPDTPLIPCKYGWEFEFNDIPYNTIVSERGWVCEYATNVPTAQSMYFLGCFFGGILFGWMADYYGRLPALMGSLLMAIIGGVGSVYTSGFWDFAICRFIVGTSFDSCFMVMYILVLEYVDVNYRSLLGNLAIALYYGAAATTLPWIAIWLKDWKTLLWVTNAPLLIVFIIPYTVPESARWLSSRGRSDKAVKVLRRFARINGTKLPQESIDELVISSGKQKVSNETIIDVVRSPILRRMLIYVILTSIGGSVIFDTLVRLSEGLGLDFFLTFTLASATEVPSVILAAFTLDKFGRRFLTYGPMSIIGVIGLIAGFVPKGIPQVALAVSARFMANISLTALFQWVAELLPTAVRVSGSSYLHVVTFVAMLVSPFVAFSERLWYALPFVTIAALAFISSGIALLLPETKGRQMPQSIKDGENLARNYTLCGDKSNSDEDLQK